MTLKLKDIFLVILSITTFSLLPMGFKNQEPEYEVRSMMNFDISSAPEAPEFGNVMKTWLEGNKRELVVLENPNAEVLFVVPLKSGLAVVVYYRVPK